MVAPRPHGSIPIGEYPMRRASACNGYGDATRPASHAFGPCSMDGGFGTVLINERSPRAERDPISSSAERRSPSTWTAVSGIGAQSTGRFRRRTARGGSRSSTRTPTAIVVTIVSLAKRVGWSYVCGNTKILRPRPIESRWQSYGVDRPHRCAPMSSIRTRITLPKESEHRAQEEPLMRSTTR